MPDKSNMFAEGCRIRDQGASHFLTFTIVGWVDIFSRQVYRDIIIDSLRYCRQNKGLQLGAYVIMSNHIHVIWRAEKLNLSDLIRDFKTYTSKSITATIEEQAESRRDWLLHMFHFHSRKTNANEYYKVWTGDNHPAQVYSESFMLQKLNYIHDNPVRAGIVENPHDYLYSSARDYHTLRKGLIEIDYLH